jgi:hypothetical protein
VLCRYGLTTDMISYSSAQHRDILEPELEPSNLANLSERNVSARPLARVDDFTSDEEVIHHVLRPDSQDKSSAD